MSFFGKNQKSNDIGIIIAHVGDGSASTYRYDQRADAWVSLASDNINVRPLGDSYATVGFKGKFYVAGGTVATVVSKAVDIYDIATNTWSAGPPMITARTSFSMAAVGNRIYAVGGNDGVTSLANVEYLEPNGSNTWTAVTPYSFAIQNSGSVGLNGLLYEYDNSNTFFSYDASANAWTQLSAPTAPVGTFCSIITLGGLIYAVGGDASNIASFDPTAGATGTWTLKTTSVPSVINSGVVLLDNRIFCMSVNAGNTNQVYYPVFDYWATLNNSTIAASQFIVYQISTVYFNK